MRKRHNNCIFNFALKSWLLSEDFETEEKLEISKSGLKTKSFESTKYVITAVDMSTVRSQIWQYLLCDKKHSVANCMGDDTVDALITMRQFYQKPRKPTLDESHDED